VLSAGHGDGGGAWRQVSLPLCAILPSLWIWPNAMDASKQQFIEKATEIAESVFKLSPSIQVIDAAPRKKWFGLF
jgi:hypothetical protein